MNAGRYTEVETVTQSLIERQPNLGLLWKMSGAALLLQDKESLPALQRAAELLPDDAETHLYLGNALHDRGEFAGAAASLRRALKIDPDFAEAHDALGLALQALGILPAAEASYRRALALRPQYAEALGNLGNVLQDLGQFEQAAASYRRMLEIKPDVAEAHNSLGNALLALGQLGQAAESYRRALAIRPHAAGALANLAHVLRELGQSQEAIASCRRALEIKPDSPETYRTLGNAQFDLGQFDSAASSYGHALALRPDYAEAHAALGMLLRQMGRPVEAEGYCRRALAIKPDDAETVALLGELHADKGQFSEAHDLFGKSLAIDPDLPEGWSGIARYRKMGDSDAAWLAAVQRLLGKGLALQPEINLRYAVGKYFDDVGDFDNAFANYRLANELTKRFGIKHDRHKLQRRVDRLMALYDRHWLGKSGNEANRSPRPIFIIGMPRSGTTLAEQILASHPAVFGAGELRFWHAASAHYEASGLGRSGNAGVMARLAEDYLRQLAGLSGDALRVVDKMPANTMNLGLIHAALPNARIIHMQRNPIDTCLSVYFQIFSATHTYAHDLDDLAHHYAQYVRVMQHWRTTLPEGAILDVPYEALVEDPEGWSRKMLDFIDLPWDPRCLDFHQTDRVVVTASNWQVRQRISKASAGRWHNYEKFVGPLRHLLTLDSSDAAAAAAAP
jgi:tetratricopeptide (TPR) repeat protein